MMSIAQMLLPEWDNEMRNTRRALERVPVGKLGFRPHEKSWTLAELATHVARLPSWATITLTTDDLDLAETPPGTALGSVDAMLEEFDRHVAQARDVIATSADQHFGSPWTLKKGAQVILTLPKAAVLRSFVLSHIIHHRGQLTVYLRLAGASVPGMYGPSADEAM
jgi:uncharacterized damage-inducible protein DinB